MIEVAMKGRDGRSEIEIKRRGLRRWKKRLIYLKEENGISRQRPDIQGVHAYENGQSTAR